MEEDSEKWKIYIRKMGKKYFHKTLFNEREFAELKLDRYNEETRE